MNPGLRSRSKNFGSDLASKFEFEYSPDFDLNRITREVPAPTLAALFEVLGSLLENPFPGHCAADVVASGDDYFAVFRGGVLAYKVRGRVIRLASVVLE